MTAENSAPDACIKPGRKNGLEPQAFTRVDRARAEKVLREEVVLSNAMTGQELDRYQFRSPGQPGSYIMV